MLKNRLLLKRIEERIKEDCENTIEFKHYEEFNIIYELKKVKEGLFSNKFYRDIGIYDFVIYKHVYDDIRAGTDYVFLFFDINLEIVFNHRIIK